jgi:ABC-2 type transport system ATP-binding protein
LFEPSHVDEIVTHCDEFYMLSQRRFNRFNDAQGFMSAYKAKSLDEAFIHAASLRS